MSRPPAGAVAQMAQSFQRLGMSFQDAAVAAAKGMTQFGRAVQLAANHLGRLARLPKVVDPRERYGAWNFTGDGLWQSDLCASWVHGECPLPGRCDCTCHGGSLH